MFSRTAIFVMLAVIAIPLGFLAAKKDQTFQINLWSQLFWLTIGTLATTFILNTILERGSAARRRKEDQFAFRTFMATVMSSLLGMKGSAGAHPIPLMATALSGNKPFAQTIQQASEMIA